MLLACKDKFLVDRNSGSPGEADFCISETKHGRRTAPKPKLFVATSRLHDKVCSPEKSVLGWSHDEAVFYCYVKKHDRRAQLTAQLLFSAERLQEESYKPESCACNSPVEDGGLGIVIFTDVCRYCRMMSMVS
jgi:hypothetical protein